MVKKCLKIDFTLCVSRIVAFIVKNIVILILACYIGKIDSLHVEI